MRGWSLEELASADTETIDRERAAKLGASGRVKLVPRLFAASLAARGIREVPRLSRVYSYPAPTSRAVRRRR
jgi:hypothetical protein